MRIVENLKKLGQAVLDLVFPIACLVCGKENIYLCVECLGKLPRLSNQQCLVCQTAAPFGKTHLDCQTRNSVDGAISGLSHKDKNVQEIIRVFKYNFVSDLSIPLSEMIVETINKQGLDNYFRDFVIAPVPLHPRRQNWRGFNQSQLLGQALADKLGIKIDDKLVARNKFTKPQVKLNVDERKRNMENAFKLNQEVTNKKILLVDDVVTSGSTANEMAKLLKQGKAAEVWIVSSAHG